MSAGLDPDLVNNSNTMIYGHAKNPYAFAGLKYLIDAKRWYSVGNNHFIPSAYEPPTQDILYSPQR